MKNIIAMMMKTNNMRYKTYKYYMTKDFIMLVEMPVNSIDKTGNGNDK